MKRLSIPLACLVLAACTAPGTRGPGPVDTSGLTGMSDAQVKAAFGTPSFVRKDGTAQIWRYDGASCRAFFFLYANGNALSVSRVETLPHGAAASADPACLAALQPRAPKTS